MINFFTSENSIRFFAIIPHHNTLAELETIQKDNIQFGFPLYPLFCPLSIVDTLTDSKAHDSLSDAQLKKFVKQQKSILQKCRLSLAQPKEKLTTIHKVLCPLQGLPKNIDQNSQMPEPFTKNAFTLLYQDTNQNNETNFTQQVDFASNIDIRSYQNASLTMRIYRIGIVTVTSFDTQQAQSNSLQALQWTFSHTMWVKE